MTNRHIQGHGSEQPDSMCDHVQELLPAYVTAQALGQPHQITPHVRAHIQRCQSCREAFEELRELTIEAYSGAVQPAPSYPQPDLAFLPARRSAPATSQPWQIDEWGRLIISFSLALLNSLRPPALVGASRGKLLYSYALRPQERPDLDVNIEVYATSGEHGYLRVNVESLERDPLDQAPSQVIVQAAGATWQGVTDETGCIAFDEVPLADLPTLTIAIATDQQA